MGGGEGGRIRSSNKGGTKCGKCCLTITSFKNLRASAAAWAAATRAAANGGGGEGDSEGSESREGGKATSKCGQILGREHEEGGRGGNEGGEGKGLVPACTARSCSRAACTAARPCSKAACTACLCSRAARAANS